MSVKAMTWAWRQQTKTQGEKLVLLKLADCANDHGICYPGVQTIMEACGLSKTGVINIIKSLEKQKLICRERRYAEFGRRTSNLYTLPLSQESVPSQPSGLNDSQQSVPDAPLGQQSGPSLGQVDGPLGQPSVPEPSDEPSDKNKPPVVPLDDLPEGLNLEAWAEWEAYRRRMGFAKYKTNRMACKLARYPPEVQAAAIDNSMSNEYKGVFPEKFNGKANRTVQRDTRTTLERWQEKYDRGELE